MKNNYVISILTVCLIGFVTLVSFTLPKESSNTVTNQKSNNADNNETIVINELKKLKNASIKSNEKYLKSVFNNHENSDFDSFDFDTFKDVSNEVLSHINLDSLTWFQGNIYYEVRIDDGVNINIYRLEVKLSPLNYVNSVINLDYSTRLSEKFINSPYYNSEKWPEQGESAKGATLNLVEGNLKLKSTFFAG